MVKKLGKTNTELYNKAELQNCHNKKIQTNTIWTTTLQQSVSGTIWHVTEEKNRKQKKPAQEPTPITKTTKKQYRAKKASKLQDHIKLLVMYYEEKIRCWIDLLFGVIHLQQKKL